MNDTPKTALDFLRRLSTRDFREMGLHQMAYIRKVHVDGQLAFAVHAADGTPLAVNETHETAISAVLLNDMRPATLH